MSRLVPSHLEAAFEQVRQAYQAVHGAALDPLQTPWPELEKGIIKLLGGPFVPSRPDHQAIAMGLAFLFGERLCATEQGFWFPNREVPEGVMIGFPDALISVSPLGAVMDALARADLSLLDQVVQDLRRSLATVKFSPGQLGGPAKLTEADYARLLDPGFVQFVALEPERAKKAWESRPDRLAIDLREALSRAGDTLPKEVRAQFEAQVVGALRRLAPDKPLSEQAAQSPRLTELVTHLFASEEATGSAPAELWEDVVLPLLYIGEPAQFPPLDEEELAAVKQGAEPLALLLDLVPYSTPAEDDGLLATFPLEEIDVPHPSLGENPSPRLLMLSPEKILPALEKFEPARTRQVLTRFSQYLQEKAGQAPKGSTSADQITDAALSLLGDLKQVAVASRGGRRLFCLRRLTETEALSESALVAIRKAVSGPRIILA